MPYSLIKSKSKAKYEFAVQLNQPLPIYRELEKIVAQINKTMAIPLKDPVRISTLRRYVNKWFTFLLDNSI